MHIYGRQRLLERLEDLEELIEDDPGIGVDETRELKLRMFLEGLGPAAAARRVRAETITNLSLSTLIYRANRILESIYEMAGESKQHITEKLLQDGEVEIDGDRMSEMEAYLTEQGIQVEMVVKVSLVQVRDDLLNRGKGPWTEEDDRRILLALQGGFSPREVGDMFSAEFRRTPRAIMHRIWSLKRGVQGRAQGSRT